MVLCMRRCRHDTAPRPQRPRLLPFPPSWEDTRQQSSLFTLVVEEVVALFENAWKTLLCKKLLQCLTRLSWKP